MKIVTASLLLTMTLVMATNTGVAQEKTWRQEPTTFRNVPWGATESEAKKIIKTGVCLKTPEDEANIGEERFCSSAFALGSASIQSYLSFSNKKFVSVFGTFDSGAYSIVKQAFEDKYGPPTSVEHSVVQTAMNAKYDQEALNWVGPNVQIRLTRLGSKVTEGTFQMMIQEYRAAQLKVREEKRSKLKDKL